MYTEHSYIRTEGSVQTGSAEPPPPGKFAPSDLHQVTAILESVLPDTARNGHPLAVLQLNNAEPETVEIELPALAALVAEAYMRAAQAQRTLSDVQARAVHVFIASVTEDNRNHADVRLELASFVTEALQLPLPKLQSQIIETFRSVLLILHKDIPTGPVRCELACAVAGGPRRLVNVWFLSAYDGQ